MHKLFAADFCYVYYFSLRGSSVRLNSSMFLCSKDWISIDDYPVVRVSGVVLKAIATEVIDLDMSFAVGAVRVLNHVE